jgi:ArsR family transcriptional regulator
MITDKEKLRLRLKAEVFKAVGQPTRLAIIELLQQGELNVGQIAGHLASDTPNISKHLSLLRKANWVGDRKQGANTFYRLLVPQAAQYLQCVDRKTRRQLEEHTGLEADAETCESAQENPANRSDDCTGP